MGLDPAARAVIVMAAAGFRSDQLLGPQLKQAIDLLSYQQTTFHNGAKQNSVSSQRIHECPPWCSNYTGTCAVPSEQAGSLADLVTSSSLPISLVHEVRPQG